MYALLLDVDYDLLHNILLALPGDDAVTVYQLQSTKLVKIVSFSMWAPVCCAQKNSGSILEGRHSHVVRYQICYA